VKLLIELAIDVYNDSRQLTLSAHSWPSRSLSKIHANSQIVSYKDEGLTSQFFYFSPTAALLQYRNPVIYREMLDIVGIHGSVDKYGVDNKFITVRFLTENLEIKSVFLGESKYDIRSAEGLLDSIKIIFRDLGIEDITKEKLTGVTTDGENANTGKNGGLWVRLKQCLKKDIFCMWCVAHRSDLVLSDNESTIMERFGKTYHVYKHIGNQLLKALIQQKLKKATAKGFLRIWKDDDSQKSKIIMTDIELSKKVAVDSITLMENEPYPGGYEEKFMNCLVSEDIEEPNNDIVEDVLRKRLRKEIVLKCKEFLSRRLSVDQENIIERMNKFINARSSIETIQAGRTDVLNLFGEHAVSYFTDDVISLYAAKTLPPCLEMNSSTAKIYHYLKVSKQSLIFSKLVQSFIGLTPHSAGPERAVSVHTILKTNKQSSFNSRVAINSRMYIALNGTGTALFDPMPAVAKFLESKERRRKLPDSDLYKSQEFIQKFFSIDSNLYWYIYVTVNDVKWKL
ncbi:Uncharacterized protein FWK35_00032969, partial [Aphis craccivora]